MFPFYLTTESRTACCEVNQNLIDDLFCLFSCSHIKLLCECTIICFAANGDCWGVGHHEQGVALLLSWQHSDHRFEPHQPTTARSGGTQSTANADKISKIYPKKCIWASASAHVTPVIPKDVGWAAAHAQAGKLYSLLFKAKPMCGPVIAGDEATVTEWWALWLVRVQASIGHQLYQQHGGAVIVSYSNSSLNGLLLL